MATSEGGALPRALEAELLRRGDVEIPIHLTGPDWMTLIGLVNLAERHPAAQQLARNTPARFESQAIRALRQAGLPMHATIVALGRDIERGRLPLEDLLPAARRCRRCGCSTGNACLQLWPSAEAALGAYTPSDVVPQLELGRSATTPQVLAPCWWVSEDLCSACEHREELLDVFRRADPFIPVAPPAPDEVA